MTNGQETDAFSGCLHYLTLTEDLKNSLKPVGKKHVVLNVQSLHESLEDLASEIIDFLDYILDKSAGTKEIKKRVLDKGRPPAVCFEYFEKHENAFQSKLRYEAV